MSHKGTSVSKEPTILEIVKDWTLGRRYDQLVNKETECTCYVRSNIMKCLVSNSPEYDIRQCYAQRMEPSASERPWSIPSIIESWRKEHDFDRLANYEYECSCLADAPDFLCCRDYRKGNTLGLDKCVAENILDDFLYCPSLQTATLYGLKAIIKAIGLEYRWINIVERKGEEAHILVGREPSWTKTEYRFSVWAFVHALAHVAQKESPTWDDVAAMVFQYERSVCKGTE